MNLEERLYIESQINSNLADLAIALHIANSDTPETELKNISKFIDRNIHQNSIHTSNVIALNQMVSERKERIKMLSELIKERNESDRKSISSSPKTI